MMLPRPMPWSDCWPGMFRLPGFGGAAVFLRSCVLIPDGGNASALGVDVGLLSTVDYVRFLGRPVEPGFSQRWSEFFFAAAGDLHPEASVPAIQDPLSGLECSVESSTDSQVELLIQIVEDMDAEEPDYAGVNFLTSRAALAQAAIDVRVLESVDEDPAAVAVPPSEWS